MLNYLSTRGELPFPIPLRVHEADTRMMDRYHAVQEFNRGVFDYLIATDESGLEGHDRDDAEEENEEGETVTKDEGSGREWLSHHISSYDKS